MLDMGIHVMAIVSLSLMTPSHEIAMGDDVWEILRDLPDPGRDDYKSDAYIRAACELQKLGRRDAEEKLLELARDPKGGGRAIVLCRMLYTAKGSAIFRIPESGATQFLGNTKYADWPLEPIELVDAVPFLIVSGYHGAGVPEPPVSYVNYCREDCEWRSIKYRELSAADKQKALNKLIASPKWRMGLSTKEREFLSSQVK